MALRRSHSAASVRVPNWLSVHSLSKQYHLSDITGNLHGLKSSDHMRVNWPLPIMFGPEKYAYSLIDIDDSRYAEETAVMSRKLIRLFYDEQIIELEWRKTYALFSDAEKKKSDLPPSVNQKTRDKSDALVISLRAKLLEIQDQRDLYTSTIRKIWDRCAQIKAAISKEGKLESLRQDLSERVRQKHNPQDPFWENLFNVKSAGPGSLRMGAAR